MYPLTLNRLKDISNPSDNFHHFFIPIIHLMTIIFHSPKKNSSFFKPLSGIKSSSFNVFSAFPLPAVNIIQCIMKCGRLEIVTTVKEATDTQRDKMDFIQCSVFIRKRWLG